MMLRASLGAGYGETVMVAVMIEAEDCSGTVARVEECEALELMAGRTSAMNATRKRASEAMVAVVQLGYGQVVDGQERKGRMQKRRTCGQNEVWQKSA